MLNDPIVIVGLARTPMGGFQGELGPLSAPQLGAAAIRSCASIAAFIADPHILLIVVHPVDIGIPALIDA